VSVSTKGELKKVLRDGEKEVTDENRQSSSEKDKQELEQWKSLTRKQPGKEPKTFRG